MIKIAWEHWNSKELESTFKEDENDSYEDGYKDDKSEVFLKNEFTEMIHTPFGTVAQKSKLKPSDRWDCLTGYTNKDITHDVVKKIGKVPGVEALAVMGRYTFCVGVGKLFEFSSVRKDIEKVFHGQ